MLVIFASIALLLGAAVGSFLNVVAYRLPRDESLLRPKSHCPRCKNPVALYDNIPIVSWFLLHGSCRQCGKPISSRYIAVEATTAVLFALLVLAEGVEVELLLGLPFITLMVVAAVIDVEYRIVPNRILVLAAVWGLLASALVDLEHLPGQLLAAAIAASVLLLVALIYPSGMGMGDVKLAAVMGLYLGSAVAPALLIGFAAGALVGIAFIVREGVKARKKAVPLAPFLALGGLVGLFVGSDLVHWYSKSFFS